MTLTPTNCTAVANFAAYSFAPPILVTPLGFLSVLIGYELLRLSPLIIKAHVTTQCYSCLHLPGRRTRPHRSNRMFTLYSRSHHHSRSRPSRPRNKHRRPNTLLRLPTRSAPPPTHLSSSFTECHMYRFPPLLLYSSRICIRYDNLRRSQIRTSNSNNLHLHLFSCGIRLSDGCKRIGYSTQIDLCWE